MVSFTGTLTNSSQYYSLLLTGASAGSGIDEALAEAEAISWRAPYQATKALRDRINRQHVQFVDMHLSLLPQVARYGFLGPIHWAIVEACDVTADGQVVLTTSVGASPTFLRCAERVLIEINRFHTPRLCGFHDIYEPMDPPPASPGRALVPEDVVPPFPPWLPGSMEDPDRLVPPTMAAAILSMSVLWPALGLPALRRPAMMMPAMPQSRPVIE